MHRDGDLQDRRSAAGATRSGRSISGMAPPGRGSAAAEGWPEGGAEVAGEMIELDTVILPARLDSDVARLVTIASNRDGISIADLLGRAAAAYDWRVDIGGPGPDDPR